MAVYFVRCGHDGPVKIGYTGDIVQRLTTFGVAWPYPPILLALITGDVAREKQIHRQLLQYRMRGEWFEASDEVLELARGWGVDSSVGVDRTYLSRRGYLAQYGDYERFVNSHHESFICGRIEWIEQPEPKLRGDSVKVKEGNWHRIPSSKRAPKEGRITGS